MLALALDLLALACALWLRPWRLLTNPGLVTPLLATLAILPPMWALPWLHHMPIRFQLSGACLVTLMLGWPLAVPTLCAAALIVGLFAHIGWQQQADLALWLGVLPATLAVLMGAMVRRWLPHNPFVYILGRAFLGTVLCLFIAGALAQWTGHNFAPDVDWALALVGRWLIAWGDAIITGMLTAIFVAFKPEWLATWSDRIYFIPPGKNKKQR
ncbi:MAG: energy-coupling factor ABC transporter permease [Burkholderiaceae bacterium]|jgi:uncharacterized membrane protein|nr:energy-coupling factor ABC transporter permease [Burkholderiaceae bacterium]